VSARAAPCEVRFGRRLAVIIAVSAFLLSVLPFLVLSGKRLDTAMDALLPEDAEISAEMSFLRDSAAGNTVAVSITADSPEGARRLPCIVADFAGRVVRDSHVEKVEYKADSVSCLDAVSNILSRYPQLTTAAELAEADARLTPDRVAAALSRRRAELLQPGGLFKKGMIASDPLGIRNLSSEKLKRALVASGFEIIPSGEAFWSRDRRSVLALLRVSAAPTDSNASNCLYAAVDAALRESLPGKGFSSLVVSAHRHAIDNERLIKRDIGVTMLAAAAGFALLFLLFFRSWRAVFVFAAPVLGMGCAIGASWIVFRRPSAIILGLGATVIGISLDYGIHVFVAANGKSDPYAAARRVSRPLVFGALTTLGVFWAFFLSSAPGYHQLAFASTVGIASSLVLSLVCLPPLLGRGKNADVGLSNAEGISIPSGFLFGVVADRGAFAPPESWKAWRILIVAVVIVLLCAASAEFVGFDLDMRKLDGAGERLRRDERSFHALWGGSTPAAAVARASSMEKAMEEQDAFAEFALERGLSNFQSLSLIWPSRLTRVGNAGRWDVFWKRRAPGLRNTIYSEGERLSFSRTAFDPFFDRLFKHDFSDGFTRSEGFRTLASRFLGSGRGDGVMVAAFFDDESSAVAAASDFAGKRPGFDIVSPKLFGEQVSEAVIRDASRAGIAAVILVVFLAWICLRRLRSTVVALLPVAFGALAIFPVHALFGANLNAMALVAAIVVAGLAIDYGIFAVTAVERGDRVFSRDAFTALTLSMLTTLAGAGALLWASHPALKTVGLVVCAGVVAAYFAAVFVVPAASVAARLCRRSKTSDSGSLGSGAG